MIVGSNNRDIEGRQRGADAHAKAWADRLGINTTVMDANWLGHGRAGGPMRNGRMLKYLEMLCTEEAEHPGLVVALPGGSGTDDLCRQARNWDGIEVLRYPDLPPELGQPID